MGAPLEAGAGSSGDAAGGASAKPGAGDSDAVGGEEAAEAEKEAEEEGEDHEEDEEDDEEEADGSCGHPHTVRIPWGDTVVAVPASMRSGRAIQPSAHVVGYDLLQRGRTGGRGAGAAQGRRVESRLLRLTMPRTQPSCRCGGQGRFTGGKRKRGAR
jgi:hypothetical protein